MISIQRRLLLGLLPGLLLLLAGSGTVFYFYVRTVLARQFDAGLMAEAQAICSLVKMKADGSVEAEPPQDAPSSLGTGRHFEFYQLWQSDGAVVVRSPGLGRDDLPRWAEGDAPVFADVALPAGRRGRAVALRFVPILDEDDTADASGAPPPAARSAPKPVVVAVAGDRDDLHRILALLLSALLAVAAVLAAGTAVIVGIVVRRGLAPLYQLAGDAARIDAQSLDFRFSLDGLPGELRPICLRLNDSLERLQKAFCRERRFTADVAHELRTPIAELRSLADVALKWEGDAQSSHAYFQDARDIARQMEGIVTTLLSLARCQSGAMTIVREPVDVCGLIRDSWQACELKARERGLAVAFDLPCPVVLPLDRTILSCIVGNLLANAVEYTPKRGRMACRVERNGTAMRISVANDTDAFAVEELPHLFEPFWRKDAARTDSAHCGLGLSLAAAYAEMLGGRLSATLPQEALLRVTLDLPIAAQESTAACSTCEQAAGSRREGDE